MSSPLVVCGDPTLIAEIQRLAAAAGCLPEVTDDCAQALRRWSVADVVLVGADLAEQMAVTQPPRRAHVHVVSWGGVPDQLFRTALALGAVGIAQLPRSDRWLVELLTDATDRATAEGLVVGVVGGAGGAGATVLAAALGQLAARDRSAMLIDADPLGPGLDRIFGLETEFGVRWDALQQTTGRLSARSLRESVPRRGGLGVLGWSSSSDGTLQPFAFREVLSAARRGHGAVVVDLARQAGELTEEIAGRCRHTVVVVPASVAGVSSAARVCRWLEPHSALGIVLRSGGLGRDEVEDVTGVPVLAAMSDQRGLEESLDLGRGPLRSRRGPLVRAASAVWEWVDGDGS